MDVSVSLGYLIILFKLQGYVCSLKFDRTVIMCMKIKKDWGGYDYCLFHGTILVFTWNDWKYHKHSESE
jgi:hypothetical protein